MFAKKKSSSMPLVFIAILMLAFGFYMGKSHDTKESSDKEKELVKTASAQNIDVKDNFELKKDAKITFKINFDKCLHIKEKSENINDDLVGLSKNRLKDYIKSNYPNYKAVVINEGNVVLEKHIDSYCDDHYEIGEEKGKIVVYKYEDGERVLFKKTEFATNNLPKADAQQITKGIVLESIEKVNEMLEDFVS